MTWVISSGLGNAIPYCYTTSRKRFDLMVNLEYLVLRIPAEESLVLYGCITFTELKSLDILRGDKLLRVIV